MEQAELNGIFDGNLFNGNFGSNIGSAFKNGFKKLGGNDSGGDSKFLGKLTKINKGLNKVSDTFDFGGSGGSNNSSGGRSGGLLNTSTREPIRRQPVQRQPVKSVRQVQGKAKPIINTETAVVVGGVVLTGILLTTMN